MAENPNIPPAPPPPPPHRASLPDGHLFGEIEDTADEDPVIRMSDPLLEVSLPEDEPTLFSALRCNHVTMVDNQIMKGFDINFKKPGEPYRVKSPAMSHRIHTSLYSPLHVAALHSSIKTITLLLDNGADMNILDEQLRTPLHFAVVANRVRVVTLLIKNGADLNLQSSSGRSPLLEAVISESTESARVLVKHGANLDLCDLKGSSVLHQLCFSRTPDMHLIRLILERGATVDIGNRKGATPLMFAATLKQIPLVQTLLEHGANINKRDNHNLSAIHLCGTIQRRVAAQEQNILLFLIHHGANINIPDKTGKTILDKAITSMSVSNIKILLRTDCKRDPAAIMEHPSMLYLFDIIPEFKQWLLNELYTPRSLMRLCRGQIRDSISCDEMMAAVRDLDLPKIMQNFILAHDVSPSLLFNPLQH